MRIQDDNIEQARIVLNVLDSVERDSAQSNRRLSRDIGIALGLANAFLRHCIKKGLVKVQKTPTRRYAYFLTPRGMAEKSRLTARYISYSLSLFRQARAECSDLFALARARNQKRIALAGCSDITEIAILCAQDAGVEVVCIIDAQHPETHFAGKPVMKLWKDMPERADAVMITALMGRPAYEDALSHHDDGEILIPPLLKLTRGRDPKRASPASQPTEQVRQ